MTRAAKLEILMLCLSLANQRLSQSAPVSPDHPWHSFTEQRVERYAEQTRGQEFAVNASATYSLSELVDLEESHNPDTRAAWKNARTQAAALGVSRAESFAHP